MPAPRTIVFIPCPLLAAAGSAAAAVDRPDLPQPVAAHAVIAVVEIDRRIAMGHQEFDDIAELEGPALRIVIDPAMLIAHQLVAGVRELWRGDLGHAALGR